MDTSLLTAAGVADLFSVDPSHIRRMAKAGRLSHFKVGSTYRFDHATVEAELQVAARSESAAAPKPPVVAEPRRPHTLSRPNSQQLDRKRLKNELFD